MQAPRADRLTFRALLAALLKDASLPLVANHLSQFGKALPALVLIASLAQWHPSAMPCLMGMAGEGMDRAAHHHPAPSHKAPFDCCAVCGCTVAPSLSSVARTAVLAPPDFVNPSPTRALVMVALARPHQHPFPLGPPLRLT